jgi:hypothetical protein
VSVYKCIEKGLEGHSVPEVSGYLLEGTAMGVRGHPGEFSVYLLFLSLRMSNIVVEHLLSKQKGLRSAPILQGTKIEMVR